MLDAEQHFVLGRVDNFALKGQQRSALTSQQIDQPADADAPDPRGRLIRAAKRARLSPDRDERVLHRLVDQLRIRAPMGQAGHEPWRVALVERREGARVRVAQGSQQLGIAANIHRSSLHDDFAHSGSSGSESAPSAAPMSLRCRICHSGRGPKLHNHVRQIVFG